MAEARLERARRTVSVSATVAIPDGDLSVHDLETAVRNAARAVRAPALRPGLRHATTGLAGF
jgi:hypothetical protein